MRRAVLAALLACAPLTAAAAGRDQAVAGPVAAVQDFNKRFSSPAFSSARLTSQNHLVLEATDLFVSSGTAKQKEWMREAFLSWTEALRVAGAPSGSPLILVNRKEGGSLWRFEAGNPKIVDEWSDDRLYYADEAAPRGKLFGFFGGQIATGGDIDAKGFNARLGTTLFNNYDVAATFGYASLDTSPKYTINTIGLVGRALYPWTQHAGWNVGAQIVRNDPSVGDPDFALSVLGGINFYLPGGTFDITLTAGEQGTYALLVGYTFYFNRR